MNGLSQRGDQPTASFQNHFCVCLEDPADRLETILHSEPDTVVETLADLFVEMHYSLDEPDAASMLRGELDGWLDGLFRRSRTYQLARELFVSRFEISTGESPEALLESMLRMHVRGEAMSPEVETIAELDVIPEPLRPDQAAVVPQVVSGAKQAIDLSRYNDVAVEFTTNAGETRFRFSLNGAREEVRFEVCGFEGRFPTVVVQEGIVLMKTEHVKTPRLDNLTLRTEVLDDAYFELELTEGEAVRFNVCGELADQVYFNLFGPSGEVEQSFTVFG